MKKKYLLPILLSFTCLLGYSQVGNVTFLNTGKMNVAAGGYNGVALYVPDAMRVAGDQVVVSHNGVTELGGNFYQDATTNVFDLNPKTTADPYPTTPSTGFFRFITTRGAATNRYITTFQNNINAFDRGSYYVAFPNIQIATGDTIVLPATMGIDAKTLLRYSGNTGSMVLRSQAIGANNSTDASLRITNQGRSSELVTLGAVVVERDMTLYRAGASAELLGGNTNPVFAFATPYLNTQLSGYYAGNWVRTPALDAEGHVRYVLANAPSASNSAVIDRSQYVIDPTIKLKASDIYLIQPRPENYDYQTLKNENGLLITGDAPAAYKKQKFYFNGKVYTLPAYQEQLFAENTLASKTLNAARTTTVNWLIGNSYTSPLSTKLIAKAMETSGMSFAPYIYLFPAGSTSYQPCAITGTGDAITVANYAEIPAMSIFMVRVSKSNTATGTFSIEKAMQVHSTMPHNVGASFQPAPAQKAGGMESAAQSAPSSAPATVNQVLFRLSPEATPGVYDLAAIGIRSKASLGADEYDIPKIYAPDFSYQLYTLSADGSKLSANGVPTNVKQVTMALRAPANTTSFKLSAQFSEPFAAAGVTLEDLITGSKTDLLQTNTYTFTGKPGDMENRFVVHFGKIEETTDLKLTAYFIGNILNVRDLTATDIGNTISVYNVQGQLLQQKTVDDVNFSLPVQWAKGVYMVKMTGNRTSSAKALKNDR